MRPNLQHGHSSGSLPVFSTIRKCQGTLFKDHQFNGFKILLDKLVEIKTK